MGRHIMTDQEFKAIQRQVRAYRARTSFPAPAPERGTVRDQQAQYGAARH